MRKEKLCFLRDRSGFHTMMKGMHPTEMDHKREIDEERKFFGHKNH